jgi:ATP-dependent DNA ligase
VQLYAFDMLAGDGDDMRKLPLSMRKTNLARLLRGRAEGIFVAGPKRYRSKAVAALVSERRTKRRGERAGRAGLLSCRRNALRSAWAGLP